MSAQHQAGIPAIIDRIEGAREGPPSQAHQATDAKGGHHAEPDHQRDAGDECPADPAGLGGLAPGWIDARVEWAVSVHVRVVVLTRGFLPQTGHSGSRGIRIR
jgi:hypothetical protein